MPGKKKRVRETLWCHDGKHNFYRRITRGLRPRNCSRVNCPRYKEA